MKNISYLVCLFFLYSCEPRTDFYYYINNNTNYQLNILIKSNSFVTADLSIQPQESHFELTHNKDTHIRHKDVQCCPCRLDSVNILVMNSTKKMVKNIYSSDNWSYKVKKFKLSRYADNVTCSFDINDSDIQ